jgi:hypothetical protein
VNTMHTLVVRLHTALALARRGDGGQATAEYALVLLGAALVALLLIAWATAGGGAGKIGHLLDAVLDTIIGKI